ncbi:hypothetical protein [Puniceibacterium sp. IMCC21224]|uniref:hypothetical protein n=1 Tax=Puniceibacterium sp. IMCC21224 TaxID=1618204 RepID=UPI00064DFB4D|nr:hypothetical protein [Puniceibacterium sp. IMCC21224]KMK65197.1 hypothetical protein IMCC21224_1127 [Puniceibacterium sp. IMCC21224]
MIELVFVTCLSLAPTECRERSLLFTDITPMTCMMGAQPELAKWADSHPKWVVSQWKCQSIRTAGMKA